MELFFLSNGKLSGESSLLGYANEHIQAMLKARNITSAVLIPYALIRSDYDARAQDLEQALGIKVGSIHHAETPSEAIEQAECILISGGNTWMLNQLLHENGLIPVQINPHYIDAHLSGHMGETRDERIAEFCAVNPSESVIALREGSLLKVSGNDLSYFSAKGQGFKVFRHGHDIREYHDTLALSPLVPFNCR